MSKKSPPRGSTRPLIEELEPRLLLSADIEGALLDPSFADTTQAPSPLIELLDRDEPAAEVAVLERREVVFVDAGVEDHEKLLEDLAASGPGRWLEVVLLDADRDGIEQITEVLADYDHLDAVHIVSHGTTGAVQLGSTWLSADTLDANASSIASWSDSLARNADLLFYGCDLAGGESGEAFAASLAKLTGADVAASVDATGAAVLGGDWDLEYATSSIETSAVLASETSTSWSGLLEGAVDVEGTAADYLSLPLGFQENVGQSDDAVDFLARGDGYTVFLTEGDAVLALRGTDGTQVLRMDLLGADPAAAVQGTDPLSGSSNYLLGDDPEAWLTDVASFTSVEYSDVYDGIDVRYYGNQRQLEYDFIVDPGADPGLIRVEFQGAESLYVDADGALVVVLPEDGGEVRFKAPYAYQDTDSGRQEVASRYVITADGQVGFEIGTYDTSRSLVIDPILDYSTFLGGLGSDRAQDITVDASGSIYLIGDTTSTDFPGTDVVTGLPKATTDADVFVTKLTADGSSLVYSTFLGGSAKEFGRKIEVDGSGVVTLGISTESADFPTTAGAFDTSLDGTSDAVVARLSADGSSLLYATYLGGDDRESLGDMTVDASGNVYVTGQTLGTGFPMLGAYDSSFTGSSDIYVAVLDLAGGGGSDLLYGTYLGGSGDFESASGIAVDASGLIYVAGGAVSSDHPVTAGAYQTVMQGSSDGYLTVLDPSAGSGGLVYSTFVGGTDSDGFKDVFVDTSGLVYLAGNSGSSDFPATAGAYSTTHAGGNDAVFAILDPAGGGASDLVYATYMGGGDHDSAASVSVAADGTVYLVGTARAGFPTVDPLQPSIGGGIDVFVATLNPAGAGAADLEFSTYLGGAGSDYAGGIALDADGNLHVAGHTESSDFPTTAGAYDETYSGVANDAFVARIAWGTGGNAIWRNGASTTPEWNSWDGSAFGTATNTISVGDFREMAGAEAPTRDEIIVLGVTEGSDISGMIWNGSSWSAFPFNNLVDDLSDSFSRRFDVAYESVSGDAMIVWHNGSSGSAPLSYRIWDGVEWSDEATIVTPSGGDPKNMTLVSSPDSDELVLTAGNTTNGHFAMVWDGTAWGDGQVLGMGLDDDVSVEYEQQSGDALVVYGKGDTSVYYRIWNGADWSAEDSVAIPGDAAGNVRRLTLGADPDSNRIAMGVVTYSSDDWLNVWDGTTWETSRTATTSGTGQVHDGIAVAFERGTGNALAAYGVSGSSVIHYRTWSSGGSWTDELTGPDIGGEPNTVILDSDPNSDDIMLSVQDAGSDVNYVLWNGAAWGTPSEQETDTTEIKNQPFLFLWDQEAAFTAAPSADLWLSTKSDVTAGGQPGTDTWQVGDIVRIGDPNLAFENTAPPQDTAGTSSLAFDIDLFAPGKAVFAQHRVTEDIQLGSSAFQLEAGDLLLALEANGTLTSASTPTDAGFTNNLAVTPKDLFVFRPDSPGDYTTGTFAILLENPTGSNISAISLIEQNTTIGDTTVDAGDFLIADSNAARDVGLWETTDVGAGSTSGTYTTLLADADPNVNIGSDIHGLDLVERSVIVGGRALSEGTVLVNTKVAAGNVGENNLAVTMYDIFALDVAKTTRVAGAGNGEATASLFFDGGDVGFDAAPEQLWSFSLNVLTAAYAPVQVNNAGSELGRGAMDTVTSAELRYDDDTQPASSVTYTVTGGLANGQLELTTNLGVAITSFTQADIDNNLVVYVHDNSATSSDTFDFDVDDGLGNVLSGQSFVFTIHAASSDPSLWMSTVDNSPNPSGTNLTSWTDGEVLAFGGPTLSLEPGTTAGTFSSLFDIDTFASSDTNIRGIHYVTQAVTVGTGITMDLQAGDVLFNIADDNLTLTSNNSVLGMKRDVIVFRPDNAGDYNQGTFTILLDDPIGKEIGAFTLVEKDTFVGDTWLTAGNLILAESGKADVDLFAVDDVGETTTSGTRTAQFIKGGEIDSGKAIGGLELVEDEVTVGGATLQSGNILVSVAGEDGNVGNQVPVVAVSRHDIFVLDVHTTTTGSGTADADATLLFQGGDVGLDDNKEALDAFTLYADVDAAPPEQVVNAGSTVAEGGSDTLTLHELRYEDARQGAASVTYTVTTTPANGQLELTTAPDVPISSFTQDDINNDRVVYVHDGSNTTSDSFGFDVDDGQGNVLADQTFSIAITPVDDDLPTLGVSTGSTVAEGGTDPIPNTELRYDDSEQDAAAVRYTLTSVTANGALRLNGSSLAVNDTFTQADIDAGLLDYVHNHSNTTSDSFGFDVDDGQGNVLANQTFSISITPVDDDLPTLGVNTGSTVLEGGTDAIPNTELRYDDSEQDAAAVRYTLTSVTANGALRLNGSSLAVNDTFTQADIDAGLLDYVHNHSNTTTDGFGFDVDDGQGNVLANQTFSISITPVDDDLPTLGVNTGSTVLEGGTDAIPNTELRYDDSEQDAAAVRYTLTSVTANGALRLNGSSLAVNDTFTQADIDAGLLDYVHNHSNTTSDSFGFDVDDGQGNVLADQTFSISITPVDDDLPIVGVNTGSTVAEGGTDAIPNTELRYDDSEQDAAAVRYTLTSVTANGTLRLNGSSLAVNDTFTQADIDAGLLDYVHNHSNTTSDSFGFDVDDGQGNVLANQAFSIAITPVDDDLPTVGVNTGSTVLEGGTDPIPNTELRYDDSEQDAAAVRYTLTSVTANGALRLNGSSLAVNDTFTQADIDAGLLDYVHNHSNTTSDSFGFDVDDGQGNVLADQAFSIAITPVDDDLPTVGVNTGSTVAEGGTDPIPNTELRYDDSEQDAAAVRYTLTSVTANGALRLNGSSLAVNDTFTQADIDAGLLDYVHNHSNTTSDSFGFDVDDGQGNVLANQTFSISITPVDDDLPTLGVNTGSTVLEGGTDAIPNTELRYDDSEQDAAAVRYTLTSVTANGALRLNGSSLAVNDTFTQADIDAGLLDYVHNHSNTTSDSFGFDVDDGQGNVLADQAFSIAITPVDDDLPTLGVNTGSTVLEGGTDAIPNTELRYDDSEQDAAAVRYTLTSVTANGALRLNGSSLAVNDTFTQADIDAGLLDYVHNHSNTTSDSFGFDVDDGQGNVLADQAFSIAITPVDDDLPTVGVNTGSTVLEGGTDAIPNTELRYDDSEQDAAAVRYTLTSVTANGALRLNGSSLAVNDTFTQADIDAGLLDYVHNHSNTTSDSFGFDVDDGQGNVLADQTFSISITPVDDDLPTLGVNTGSTVLEGGTDAIPNTELRYDDSEQDAAAVRYTLTSVTANGALRLNGSSLAVNDTFTQADIDAGLLDYVHNHSNTTSDSFGFDVDDGQGNVLANQAFSIAITPVDDDLPTVGVNTGSTVLEGGTDPIPNTELRYDDSEQDPGAVRYTLTSVTTNGTLRLNGSDLVLNDTFTQQDIDDGLLAYAHSGTNTTSDGFGFDVDDGQGNVLADQTFSIAITPVDDDLPTVGVNTGSTVAEGGTDPIPNTELRYDDSEQDASAVRYTLTSVTANGALRLNGSSLAVNDTFTQADIDAGLLDYVHNHSNTTSDGFGFDVDDGQGNTLTDQTFSITITPVDDDAPTVGVNTGSTVGEGGTDLISNNELRYDDSEQGAGSVTYTLTSATANGTLRLNGSALAVNDTFTQADIDAGLLDYAHDGSETTSDSFGFDVDDGQGNVLAGQIFSIAVGPVNEAPIATDDPGPFESQILSLAPAGYWRLGEAGGAAFAADAGSANNAGTYMGPTLEAAGAINGEADTAASFDGTDDYVAIGHDASYLLDSGTVQLWFNADSIGTTQGLFSKDALEFETGGHLRVRLTDSGTVEVRLQSATADFFVESATVTAGEWHHVAFTFGSSGMGLHVDGQLVDTNAYTGGLGTTSGGAGNFEPIALGASTGISDAGLVTPIQSFFAGSIDEVAIFGTPLSPEQIQDLHAAGLQDYTIAEEGTLNVGPEAGVVSNDYDAEGDPLTAFLVTGPTNAAAFSLNPDGSFSYTPTADFTGTDTFTYYASDGTNDSNLATATITVTPVNDQPQLGNNSLTIAEGGTVTLAASDLSATDVDTDPTTLTFTVSSVQSGHFELLGGPTTTFTQADVTAGSVTFVHDGTDNAPSYDVTVGDGSLSDGPEAATITFIPVDDAVPTVGVNTGSTVLEGGTDPIPNTELRHDDSEQDASAVRYTLTSVTANGTLRLNGSSLAVNDTFTQADIDAGLLDYVHNHSNTTSDGFGFDVDDGQGNVLADQTFSIAITPVDDDLPTVGVNTGSTVAEGGTDAIPNTELRYDDSEQDADAVRYTLTSVTANGTLRLNGSSLAVNDTFTQADIDAGLLDYVHNHSNTTSDGFGFDVGDGQGNVLANQTFSISITPVDDDLPTLGVNTGSTVAEGGTDPIPNTELRYDDSEQDADAVRYTLTSVTANGALRLNGSSLAVNDTFTQADIDAGLLDYVHNHSNTTTDGFGFDVDDGQGNVLANQTFSISITPVDDDLPTLGVNTGSTVAEGGTDPIPNTELRYDDSEQDADAVRYTLTSVTANGTIRLNGSSLAVNDTFAQADIDAGLLDYVHNHSNTTSDGFGFDVDDGQGNVLADQTFSIAITPVDDDLPTVGLNTGSTVVEGGTDAIPNTELRYDDSEQDADAVRYTLTSVTANGTLRLNGSSLAVNDTFTQADIDAGLLDYVHNHSNTTSDGFGFDVDDGQGNVLADQTFSIAITPVDDDLPTVGLNTGSTVVEGGTDAIPNTELRYDDSEQDADAVRYTLTSVTANGTLRLNGSSLAVNDTFTQADIDAGLLDYVHNHSNTTSDGFGFDVDDGQGNVLADQTFSIAITPVDDDLPTVGLNTGSTVVEGGTDAIPNTELRYDDSEQDADAVRYTLTSVTANGTLRLNGSSLAVNDTFTQADIDAGLLDYVHNHSNTTSDGFGFDVDDGQGNVLADQSFSIAVTPVDDDLPTLGVNTGSTVLEGGTDAIPNTELRYDDSEQDADAVRFTLTSLTANGTLRLNGSDLAVNDTFTQADIDAGLLDYVHNHSNTTSDGFGFDVDDGQGNILADQTFSIVITPVDDDLPTVGVNTGSTVLEGGTDPIANTELRYDDSEQDADAVRYTLTSITANGTLRLNGSTLAVNDTFTQADIDAGLLDYVHNHSNTTTDGFGFDVDDGQGNVLADQTFDITITPVDDDLPTEGVNTGSTVVEGGTDAIPNTELRYDDSEQDASAVRYTLTSVTVNGTLRLNGSSLAVNDTFTQADIDAGLLDYVHNHSNTTSDGFGFDVDDGQGNVLADQSFSIAVTPVDDDLPTVGVNTGSTVAEGGTDPIPNTELRYDDSEQDASSVRFTLTSVTANGTLRLNGSDVALNDTFTQQDIDDGLLAYVHSGTNTTSDGFAFDVDDGQGNVLTDQTFSIAITPVDDDLPTVGVNTGSTVAEGGTDSIPNTELRYDDSQQDADAVRYTLTSVTTNGTLRLSGSSLAVNDTFTQADIDAGLLDYVHNHSNTTTDGFGFDVDDGQGNVLANQTFSISITPVDDDLPTVGVNTGSTVVEGGTDAIPNTELRYDDSEQDADALRYTLTSVTANGALRLNGSGLAVNDTFTQADIDAGLLDYVHNHSNTTTDNFGFDVDDGQGNVLADQTFAIAITPVDDDLPTVGVNTGSTVAEGGTDAIPNTELRYDDSEQNASDVRYTLTSATANGTLRLNGSSLAVNDTFTQADIDAGLLDYIHNPSNTTTDGFGFDVDDGQGNVLANQTFSISITPVDDDLPTVGVNTGSTVVEGGTDPIPNTELRYDDSEQDPGAVRYTLTSVTTNGTLRLNGSDLVLNDTFTQADIDAGLLDYVHNHSNTTTDGFGFDVDDGQGNVLANQTFSISITPVDDDLPTVGLNTGSTVAEGGTDAIPNTELRYDDSEQDASAVRYTLTSVTANGTLRLSGSSLAVNDTFTQADIDAGLLDYVHNHSNTTSDGFGFDVDDGRGNVLADQTFSIAITPVDDDLPTVGVNTGSTVAEGGTDAIPNTELRYDDSEQDADALRYTLTSVTANGALRLNGSGLAVNDTFTQADIDAGLLDYVHNHSNTTTDNFGFDVDDGQGNVLADQTFAIAITPVDDDLPTVGVNTGSTVAEGGTDAIPNTELRYDDSEQNANDVRYTLTSATANGALRLNGSGLAVNDTFTQADIDAGLLDYVHNHSNTTTDNFGFDVDDGQGNVLADQTFAIAITPVDDDLPTVGVNTGSTVAEGGTDAIPNTELRYDDSEQNASDVRYTLTSATANGTLRLNGSSLAVNDTFTQADIDAGLLHYIHNHSNTTTDGFGFDVDDGQGNTLTDQTFSITITPENEAPTLASNSLSIAEGGTVILGSGDLSATDVDVDPGTLMFSVSDVQNGHFERVANPGPAITMFGQADVAAGRIQFVHDGGEIAPSYEVEVSDGVLIDGPHAAVIDFANVNDAPVGVIPGAQTVEAGFALAFSPDNGNAISMSDVDSSTLQVTLRATDGTVSLGNTNGITFLDGDGLAAQAMTFAGSVADVNAALDGLSFQPLVSFSGDTELEVEIDDGSPDAVQVASIPIEVLLPFVPDDLIDVDPAPVDDPTSEPGDPEDPADPGDGDTPPLATVPVSGPVIVPLPETLESPETPSVSAAPPEDSSREEASGAEERRDGPNGGKRSTRAATSPAFVSPQLSAALDQLGVDLRDAGDRDVRESETVVATTEGVALVFSTGLLAALLRSGSLFAAALSSLPLWRRVDPLAVLALTDEERKKREKELREAEAKEDHEEADVGRLLDDTDES